MMRRDRFEPRIYVAGYPGILGSAILRRLKADTSTDLPTRTRGELDMRAPHLRLPLGLGGGEGTIRVSVQTPRHHASVEAHGDRLRLSPASAIAAQAEHDGAQ